MSIRIVGIVVLAAVATAAPKAIAGEARAVVELFTSQGCSSCPPADKLMGELVKDPNIVALTLPVDYWDYLGWKDTLALHSHAERQRAYAQSRSDRNVYTPQMVVNGAVHTLGSDKAAIDRALTQTQSQIAHVSVAAAVSQGTLKVDVGAGGQGDIWLCPISKAVPVKIERGENKGHTFTYYNVVRGWTKLGELDGKARTFETPVAQVAGSNADAVAVIVQSSPQHKPGPIAGAALADLH